ncbi:MAG: hypothetical protein RI897_3690 [Verrucomicrobiota bacterium]|jgi:hypothetical protein
MLRKPPSQTLALAGAGFPSVTGTTVYCSAAASGADASTKQVGPVSGESVRRVGCEWVETWR